MHVSIPLDHPEANWLPYVMEAVPAVLGSRYFILVAARTAGTASIT